MAYWHSKFSVDRILTECEEKFDTILTIRLVHGITVTRLFNATCKRINIAAISSAIRMDRSPIYLLEEALETHEFVLFVGSRYWELCVEISISKGARNYSFAFKFHGCSSTGGMGRLSAAGQKVYPSPHLKQIPSGWF